jgi:hypothetical protein
MVPRSKVAALFTLIFLALSVCSAYAAPYAVIGKGCTTGFYIDEDCDGYGVGAGYVTGVDVDDTDPTVNTTATVEAKYGNITTASNITIISNLKSFLAAARGYNNINDIWFIAPDGDDSTGAKNDITKPFASVGYSGGDPGIKKAGLNTGDLVLFRGGTYSDSSDQINLQYGPEGSNGSPIIFMSFPGELAIFTHGNTKVYVEGKNWFIFDTLQLGTPDFDTGGNGVQLHNGVENVECRYLECVRNNLGCRVQIGMINILFEKSVVSRSYPSHNMYWGSAYTPNNNITMKGCISYGNRSEGYHGFKHNGYVTNLVVDGNIIHSNSGDGIDIENDVDDSIIKNNLVFNNGLNPLKLYTYSTAWTEHCDNNLIINNVFWAGRYPNSYYPTSPSSFPAVNFINTANDDTHEGNIFKNNIFISYGSGPFNSDHIRHVESSTVQNNVFYRLNGSDIVCTIGGTTYNLSEFESIFTNVSGNTTSDPLFENVSVDYNDSPGSFNFDPTSGSPVINFGTSTGAPNDDLRNYTRSLSIPDAGCYESPHTQPPVAPTGLKGIQ